jgi:hypothetical protein
MNPSFLADRIPEAASLLILAIPAALHAIVAEAGVVPAPDWMGSVTQISAFGLVAWIVYYMFTSWLPKIQAANDAQLAAQREAHTVAMATIADAHASAIKEMTIAFSDSLKTQRADLLAIRAVCRIGETGK